MAGRSAHAFAACLGVLLALCACTPLPRGVAAGWPPGSGAAAVAVPDVEGLPNLARVDAGLWRSGQPTAQGMREARARGVRTVVNLRHGHTDRDLLGDTGLALVEVPTYQWDVDDADLLAALQVLVDPARRPVLVHCAQGRDRTGVVVAAYRRAVQGWSAEDALREMRAFHAAPWWVNLSDKVRSLDPEALRAELPAPPPPRVGLRR